MFEGFTIGAFDSGETNVRFRTGGSGPPLLLLHGCPQTSIMWGPIADDLARHFTIVAPDLRGYGGTGFPETTPDHEPYSKRAMNRDQIALMRHLGHERFAVAGHDRGGRCAYRLAMDHPGMVTKLALLDIIPTAEAYRRTDFAFASAYFHWFFLTKAAPFPEKLLANDDQIFFLGGHSPDGGVTRFLSPEALAEYHFYYHRPENLHGMCEDYRAGIGLDRLQDEADIAAGRRLAMPTLILWGEKGIVARSDPMAIWRRWAGDVRGQGIDCGHFLPEERPAETARALLDFFLE